MDTVSGYQRKSSYLEKQNMGHLLESLQARIHAMLIQEHDMRLFSPAMIRALTFDLTYVLLRHRAWHNAPILSELSVDYLNSEFLVPRALCTQLVESSLDLLHSYTPSELEWTAEKYEEEFLEHLFICATLVDNDQELIDDIGFGRNLSELLRTAMILDQDSGNPGLFQFAAELAGKLHQIMSRIMQFQQNCPWALDLYHLKNILQRDSLTRKSNLQISYLERLFSILTTCSWQGIETKLLSQALGDYGLSADLNTLVRCGLIYGERRRNYESPLNRLSAKGLALTQNSFALQADQSDAKLLLKLPPPYQTALIARILKDSPNDLLSRFPTIASGLAPEALRIVFDEYITSSNSQTLLEIFKNLLHNRAHAWTRLEICQALPLTDQGGMSQEILQALAGDDPSPMVRHAAKQSLKRLARQTGSMNI